MRRINPNVVTSLRLFIFAPLACFFLTHNYLALALTAMALGELTDFFDGLIARKTGQISNFGKIFDPMCDSVFHMIVWMSFQSVGWVSVYFVILFFVRDSTVSTIRIYLASHNIVLAARISGKVKAVAQASAQIVLVLLHLFSAEKTISVQLLIVSLAALVTAYSLCDYSWAFYQLVKERRVELK